MAPSGATGCCIGEWSRPGVRGVELYCHDEGVSVAGLYHYFTYGGIWLDAFNRRSRNVTGIRDCGA